MFKKLKYKLWQHITKDFVTDPKAREALFASTCTGVTSSESATTVSEEVSLSDGINIPKIIAIQGMLYSGSSTLVGMFHEFDNVRVVGFPDPAWCGTEVKARHSECKFFSESGVIDMIRSFRKEPPEVINAHIRMFAYNIGVAYTKNRINVFENLPELYNDTFRKVTQEYLLRILDLDDHTRAFMKDKIFPYNAPETEDYQFDGCSFVRGQGKKRYISYSFADLSEEEFFKYTKEFLEKILSIISGSEYVVYDQALPWKTLEFVNQYLDVPIKQIVVHRDPRDQFLSADRRVTKMNILPRTAPLYRDNLLKRIKGVPANNPDRLVLRFEDIVLNYEATKKKIMDFLGLKPENHVAPKSIFNPSISVTNIGAWRSYHRQEFMQEIEELLGAYCFYPEKENLSDEAIELLISGGNWDDKIAELKKEKTTN